MNTNIDAYKLFQFLQKITGCDIEKKLGKSSREAFRYYRNTYN